MLELLGGSEGRESICNLLGTKMVLIAANMSCQAVHRLQENVRHLRCTVGACLLTCQLRQQLPVTAGGPQPGRLSAVQLQGHACRNPYEPCRHRTARGPACTMMCKLYSLSPAQVAGAVYGLG